MFGVTVDHVLVTSHLWTFCTIIVVGVVFLYLFHINHIMKGVPEDVQKLAGSPWTATDLRRTYKTLSASPIDYHTKLPPKLDRRYIVVGGNGVFAFLSYEYAYRSRTSLTLL